MEEIQSATTPLCISSIWRNWRNTQTAQLAMITQISWRYCKSEENAMKHYRRTSSSSSWFQALNKMYAYTSDKSMYVYVSLASLKKKKSFRLKRTTYKPPCNLITPAEAHSKAVQTGVCNKKVLQAPSSRIHHIIFNVLQKVLEAMVQIQVDSMDQLLSTCLSWFEPKVHYAA